jgi:hypothetical protein
MLLILALLGTCSKANVAGTEVSACWELVTLIALGHSGEMLRNAPFGSSWIRLVELVLFSESVIRFDTSAIWAQTLRDRYVGHVQFPVEQTGSSGWMGLVLFVHRPRYMAFLTLTPPHNQPNGPKRRQEIV